jgi:hypothetical protein
MFLKNDKRAQVTIYIIIAALIVTAVLIFSYVSKMPVALPTQIKPVETYFTNCIKLQMEDGISALGQQAGYITLPTYEPGSDYAPFSSWFNFVGMDVPFWFYISRNNIAKTQVPTIEGMQSELNGYISQAFMDCTDFSSFESQGYIITKSNSTKIDTKIRDNSVNANIEYSIGIKFQGVSRTIQLHSVQVKSDLGRLFKEAKAIYDNEQQRLFLENYSMDVIAMYAPNSGFEFSCVPKLWQTANVSTTVKDALQANLQTLKLKGTYYSLRSDERKYFVFDAGQSFDDAVTIRYSSSWPTTFEVQPQENGVMKADPVGAQAGLSALGFCYITYHFVYSAKFPVLIQIASKSTGEIFQFPVVVVIEKNKPKNATAPSQISIQSSQICAANIQPITVYTSDSSGDPVAADISFKCIDAVCPIGKTKIEKSEALLTDLFPQCVNGFIVATAPGFVDKKYMISTNNEVVANILMSHLYNLSLSFDSQASKDKILVTARELSGGYSTTVLWPDQKSIQLQQGDYEIKTTLFKQGNITLSAQKTEQCVKVPAEGVAGFFGATIDRCLPLNTPSMTLTDVPAGGGVINWSVSEDSLKNSRNMLIHTNIFTIPKTLEDLQYNYNLIDNSQITQPELS